MGVDLAALNEYLADKTFIEGCVPPQRLAASPAALFAPCFSAASALGLRACWGAIGPWGELCFFQQLRAPAFFFLGRGGAHDRFPRVVACRRFRRLDQVLTGALCLRSYAPSQADVATYDAAGAGVADEFPHVKRFLRLIDSYSTAKKAALPGTYAAKFGSADAAAPAPAAAAEEEEDAGEDDLWGDEDEEAEEENEKRLAAIAAAHKAKKAAAGKLKVVIAMSKVILDVKPWDDTTDMAELEKLVRGIKHPTNPKAIEWQAGALEDIGYGIKKLRIMVQVIDDEVSVDVNREAFLICCSESR